MRQRLSFKYWLTILVIVLVIFFCTSAGLAQTTGFTYQGRLTDGGTAANGNYDLQFALWDSVSGGNQVGSTQTLNTVGVSNGVFTVSLDFGATAFNGANRFLEIRARPSGGGSFTLLTPRQQITSTPYAVRSLNAASADSVPANGVSAGSGNYIQNSSSPQTTSNFNISGNGTAGGTLSGNVVNATSRFNLNGIAILSNAGTNNLFVGSGAGIANNGGQENTFIGANAGLMTADQLASDNTFVGFQAGRATTTGAQNTFVGALAGASSNALGPSSFFGFGAGSSNTTGSNNAFFGNRAGFSNTTGNINAFFGDQVALNNSSGSNNAFFGSGVASVNSTGSRNAFFGNSAGFSNVVGSENTLIGFQANVGSNNLANATAIGANARVDQSNSLVLGSINGANGATADTKVGIGTTTPTARLSVIATGEGARVLQLGIERAWVFKQMGTGATSALELTGDDPNNNNKNFVINTAGNVGIGTTVPTATLSVNGTANKPGGGSWESFSDERLKNIKGRFTSGLRAVMQLQPLRYEYKRDNALNLKSEVEHIGFSAQDIQQLIPEAVSSTEQGYLLVNNDPILWTMLNAIKEQQAQIQLQGELIERQRALAVRQQQDLSALKKLACRTNRRINICR